MIDISLIYIDKLYLIKIKSNHTNYLLLVMITLLNIQIIYIYIYILLSYLSKRLFLSQNNYN